MTEKALNDIVEQARARWPSLQRVSVIHRVGQLNIGEEIVFVGVTSAHRHSAFESAEFIMDFLKTRAHLFWKKRGYQLTKIDGLMLAKVTMIQLSVGNNSSRKSKTTSLYLNLFYGDILYSLFRGKCNISVIKINH